MRVLALLAVAGALGTLARYGLGKLVQSHAGSLIARLNLHSHVMNFPFGTLVVNLVGCVGLGLLSRFVPTEWRLPIVTGFFGAFTTFATFSMETVNLMQGGDWWKACFYFGMSVVGGLLGIWAGLKA